MPAANWDPVPEDWDDRDFPADEDFPEDDESSETVRCPACGADVYEDADMCPACGEFLIRDTRVWSDKPAWWIVLGMLGILALTAALVLGI
jgi:hypothetical protein